MLVGGGSLSVGGLPRLRLAKVSATNGAPIAMWNAPVGGTDVRALAVAPGGIVYVAGVCGTVGGATLNSLAALAPDALFNDGFE